METYHVFVTTAERLNIFFTASMETYHVFVTTADIRGAGTDANVYVVLYGEKEDTGMKMFWWNKYMAWWSVGGPKPSYSQAFE